MDKAQRSILRVIILYLVLAFFSVPYLIDDFLCDIPPGYGALK